MGDQDSQELPQRVRGVARSGPHPSAPPALSDEVRQRMQAAVLAERADASQRDADAPTGPLPKVTGSGAVAIDAVSPVGNGISRCSARSVKLDPVKPDPVKPDPVKPDPVKPDPVKSDPAANGSASQKPAAPVPASPSLPPQANVRRKPGRRRIGVLAALAVILTAALGAMASWYFTRTPPGISPGALQGQELTSRGQAATWVAQQVSHSAIVSCDPLTCRSLAAAGFPAGNLRALGPTSPYPVTSDVVVVTAVVHDIFGSSLSVDWAPMVLATFGSGTAQVAVRVIGPHGAAAYQAAVSADLAARKKSAVALLEIPDIDASAAARNQLMAGQVDSRLLLAIADVAADQPIDVVDFGNIAPGEDAGIPLRYADLAENDQARRSDGSAYVRSLVADLRAVRAQFRPASTDTVVLPGGQRVLRVEFAAPSPLGLLGS